MIIALVVIVVLVIMLILVVAACSIVFALEICKPKSETPVLTQQMVQELIKHERLDALLLNNTQSTEEIIWELIEHARIMKLNDLMH